MASFSDVQYFSDIVGGSEKVQNYADVIYGWFLNYSLASFSLFVTSKKRNHEFTNLRYCKKAMVFYFLFIALKAFKMKKKGLKCFLKTFCSTLIS